MPTIEASNGEGQTTGLTFGSDDAVQHLRKLAKLVEQGKAAVAAATRKRVLVHENIGALEVVGKNPKQEIASAREEVQNAEGALQLAKSNLNLAFLEGRRDFDALRGRLINEFRASTVDPKICQIRKLVEDVEVVINKLAEEFDTIETDDETNRLAGFDRGIVSWNALVAQLAGPGNALIDSLDSARWALSNILLSAVREIARIETAAKRLREAANTMQAKLRQQIMTGSSTI